MGKPRVGESFEIMNRSRSQFKKVLNECKRNENKERSISIKEKFEEKDMKSFWRDVQKSSNKIKNSEVIDGKSNKNEVIEIFSKKFLDVLCVEDNDDMQNLITKLKSNWLANEKFYLKISPVSLKRLIKKLSIGEGHDGINTLFLRRASNEFLVILSKFLMACYTHCFLPDKLLYGDINPTIKDTKGNATDSCNYRPVMQSSCILKLIELHLMEILPEKIFFNSRQFGFKCGTSTSDACLILKETVHKYIHRGDKVYSMFVDLSKAFDTVNHFIMGDILLQKNIPPDIVLLVMNYLRNQRARIVWDGAYGRYFSIERGVRQGGILSPFLFKLYIDDILGELTETGLGCQFGILRMNVLAYADDLVILANFHTSLDELYVLLREKFSRLKLVINKDKSKCIIFSEKKLNLHTNQIEIGGDIFEIVNQYKYLGHIIMNNLMDSEDIGFRLKSFYSRFYWVFRKFNQTTLDILLFLFNSFCAPDYGLPLWCLKDVIHKQYFKTFEVAYNKSFKKILNVPQATSNHAVADACNILLFRHHCYLIQTRFFKRILHSKNEILGTVMQYLKEGYLYRSLSSSFYDTYHCRISDNPLDSLKSRIWWIQRHEPQTGRPLTT